FSYTSWQTKVSSQSLGAHSSSSSPCSKASPKTRYVVKRNLAEFPTGRKKSCNSRRKLPAGRKGGSEPRSEGDKMSRQAGVPDLSVPQTRDFNRILQASLFEYNTR